MDIKIVLLWGERVKGEKERGRWSEIEAERLGESLADSNGKLCLRLRVSETWVAMTVEFCSLGTVDRRFLSTMSLKEIG